MRPFINLISIVNERGAMNLVYPPCPAHFSLIHHTQNDVLRHVRLVPGGSLGLAPLQYSPSRSFRLRYHGLGIQQTSDAFTPSWMLGIHLQIK